MAFDAKKLRELRKGAGLSMRALADKAGVGPTTIYELERGGSPYPRMETVSKIAAALSKRETVFFAAVNRETDKTPPAA